MTTKVKKLKALLGLDGTSDPNLLKQLNAAHDGMNGNSAFSTPPVDMPTFKAGIDKLTVLVTDAEDGGKKAISAKKMQRAEMIKQYTLLGHYVEAASNDDPAVFHTSGFMLAPTTHTPPQPLPPATWTTVTIPGSKKWTISNLTPGANYAFQIRALGRLGYTDWSASTNFICG